jgi:hypothetical protein
MLKEAADALDFAGGKLALEGSANLRSNRNRDLLAILLAAGERPG